MANRKSKKRDREILDAAAAVFAERGYHGASTKDIADKLGIQQAGVYYYFKSKDEALAEVCRVGVGGYLETLQEVAASGDSPSTKVKSAVAAHMIPFHDLRNHVRVFHNERRFLAGEFRNEVRRLADKYEKVLEGIITEGVKNGAFRNDLDCRLATLALLGMCNSVAAWYEGSEVSEIETIADQYGDLIVGGLKA